MRRAAILVVAVAVLVVACKKNPIGGECSAAMDCAAGAERCFKMENETKGVCSKTCTADSDCGAIATCQEVEVSHTGGVYGKEGVTFHEKWCLPKK